MQTKDETSADDELLTAYLDGEMNETEMQQLRQRLVQEEALRDRLAQLQRTWDLLDDLPSTPADPGFTKSTLEMVTLRTDAEVKGVGTKSNVRRNPLLGLWAKRVGLIVAALGFGLLAGCWYRIQDERNQLSQLKVWADSRSLGDIESIDMARQLMTIPSWEVLADEFFATRMLPPQPTEIGKKRAWIESLTPEHQAMVKVNKDYYENLDSIERDRVWALSRKIDQEPDAAEIRKAIRCIHALLESDTLSEDDLTELNQLKLQPNEYVNRIKELACIELSNWYVNNMEEEDRTKLLEWWEGFSNAYLRDHQDVETDFLSQLITSVSAYVYVRLDQRYFRRESDLIKGSDFESLFDLLSPRASNILQGLPVEKREAQVFAWVGKAMGNVPARGGRMTPEMMFDAFKGMSKESREVVELKNANDARGDLTREARSNRRGRGGPLGGGRGGPFPPNPTPRGALPPNP